jgi:LysM repeat protein
VEDLQKFNHIEDGRKLQAGQTIMIPTPSVSPGVSASPSPSPSVAE